MKRTLMMVFLINLMLSACASVTGPTPAPSATPLAAAALAPTNTATPTATPTPTPAPSATPLAAAALAPTNTATPTATPTETLAPSATPTATPTPTATLTPTATREPRRLLNGTFIKRTVPLDGYGELRIDNGTPRDAVAVLTTLEKETVFSVYVQARNQIAVEGIRDGTYKLFFMLGEDWDDATGRFTRVVSYEVFEDTFPYETTATTATIWSVTLHAVITGTANTISVPPKEFPPTK